jgi:hypothetical protein
LWLLVVVAVKSRELASNNIKHHSNAARAVVVVVGASFESEKQAPRALPSDRR